MTSLAPAHQIGEGSLEIVEGAEALDARIRAIGAAATKEVVAFTTVAQFTNDQVKTAKSRNSEIYDRGLTSRSIYLDSVRNDQATKAHVQWLNERGSQVRTRPTLPIQMLIADGEVAVLPLDITGKQPGIKVISDPYVVLTMQTLFEQTWLAANPLGLSISTKNSELDATQRAVLEMLWLGYVDHEVGARMGIDKRTVRRRVAEIMHILDTSTRFQAGAKAAKQGLI